MKNGYEQTYDVIAPRLMECDFPDAAQRLGFTLTAEDTLSIAFLGRTYEVTHHGVRPVDDGTVNVNILSVLVYYTISKGSCVPMRDFHLMHNFTHGLFTSSNSGSEWIIEPLRKEFGADYQKFHEAALELGMEYAGSRVAGEYTWYYSLLPKIPIKVVYYEADDEFPCEVRRPDKTVLQFIDFEPLAVLNGCFVGALAAIGKKERVPHHNKA
jgi:hypothetical protein